MDFKEATEGLSAALLARAFRVSPQTIRQYRLDSSSSGHRSPPSGWQSTVARILDSKGDEYKDRARLVADSLDSSP